MQRIVFLIIILGLFSTQVSATHNRAGEITYEQISEFTYRVTVTTYTYTLAIADRPEIEIFWGDGTSSIIPRVLEEPLPDYYKRNTYVYEHTYPGTGVYEIVVEDPNRNDGVINIPGSVQVIFAIKTTLSINPLIGYNNTPILLNPPIDKAGIGHIFIHNPAAFDPDGDSLSYKLAICLSGGGEPIEDYTYPTSSNEPIYVDAITGDLIWNTPIEEGIYNVAMEIEEWRSGVKIGYIIRDMQIEVHDTDNEPPIIDPLRDWCVEAGDTVEFTVTARDSLRDIITLTATGAPFGITPTTENFVEPLAIFPQPTTGRGIVSSLFNWQTSCQHVRKQPYLFIFKAKDDYDNISLVDYENVNIKIVAPAPKNLTTEATNNTITLNWESCECSNAIGYSVYRRNMPYEWTPDSCETGLPGYTGYTLINQIDGYANTTFLDNNNGDGLLQGYYYCYRVVAYFDDRAESYASEEACEELTRGMPIISHVDVLTTDQNEGQIRVKWIKPTELDLQVTPGPFKYIIYRSPGFWGDSFVFARENIGLDDTTFVDTELNTQDTAWVYKVALFAYDEPNDDWFLVGSPQIASSVYLQIRTGDNQLHLDFLRNTPWLVDTFEVYRRNENEADFSYVGLSTEETYTDNNLLNGLLYHYYTKSLGHYDIDDILRPLINHSQINSEIPIDTFPPCTIQLSVNSLCDDQRNELIWQNPNDSCPETDDVVKYYVYYSPTLSAEPTIIDSIVSPEAPTTTTFDHFPTTTMAGCYQVAAIDSFDNQSISGKVCVDICTYYELPNVFTPDGDGFNDLFKPLDYPREFIDKANIRIFNRWGRLVFETDNPDIEWNGKLLDTDKKVTSGVYYYICDVYEKRLSGIQPRNITGLIHVFINETNKP